MTLDDLRRVAEEYLPIQAAAAAAAPGSPAAVRPSYDPTPREEVEA
jgi:hypothetical protein